MLHPGPALLLPVSGNKNAHTKQIEAHLIHGLKCTFNAPHNCALHGYPTALANFMRESNAGSKRHLFLSSTRHSKLNRQSTKHPAECQLQSDSSDAQAWREYAASALASGVALCDFDVVDDLPAQLARLTGLLAAGRASPTAGSRRFGRIVAIQAIGAVDRQPAAGVLCLVRHKGRVATPLGASPPRILPPLAGHLHAPKVIYISMSCDLERASIRALGACTRAAAGREGGGGG